MTKTDDQKNVEGHRKRLRERFLQSGLGGFHDYEVIELLLTLVTPRRDCKQPAKSAIKKFKTLQGVIEAPEAELCEIKGIGPKNIFGLKLIPAVANRYLKERVLGKDPMLNSKQLFEHLYHSMRDKDREYFRVLFLDAKNHIISSEVLFEGTLTSGSVYPRELIRAALNHKAAALIFCHNHPSGDPSPSDHDIALTRRLIFSCEVIGIVVHEHLVIGNNRYFSFADHGLVDKMKKELAQYL